MLISRGLYQKLMHTNLLSRSLYQKLMICIGVYRSVHVTLWIGHNTYELLMNFITRDKMDQRLTMKCNRRLRGLMTGEVLLVFAVPPKLSLFVLVCFILVI